MLSRFVGLTDDVKQIESLRSQSRDSVEKMGSALIDERRCIGG